MKAFLTVITAGALTMSAVGQGITTQSSVNSDLNGTDLVAELNKSVNSKKAKAGEEVKATLTQDVLAHGKIVIRRGSKLVGHVIEAKPRSKEDQESRLGLVFDKAVLKGGQEIDLNAVVRALAPPMRFGSVDRPDMMGPPTSGMGAQSGTLQPLSSGPGGTGGSSVSRGSGSTTTNPATNQASRAAQYASASTGISSGAEGGVMGGGSRGVFGMPGLKLVPAAKGQAGSVISSTRHDVRLESGTQLVIQVTTK